MRKNIFLITSISFILLLAVLYSFINVDCNTSLKNAIKDEQNNSLAYLAIAASELKSNYLKADDISVLYLTEYFAKIKNISEVFILDKDLTVVMHNDSNKWNNKMFGDIYDNIVKSTEQLTQQVNNKSIIYSLPIDDTSFACFVLSFEDIINNYSVKKNKLYLYSLILSLIVSIIIYLLCYTLFLKPFIKTKQILTVQGNDNKTIYSELTDMAKEGNITKRNHKFQAQNILPVLLDKINSTKKNIAAVLDENANIIYCSNLSNEIFKSSKTNIHIMEATNNAEIINAVSNLLEHKNDIKEITISSLQIKSEALFDTTNNLTGILLTKIN